ncbi:hypothetical protein O181_041279 [Austropuccinia psidii MF-1]|uniref:Uncharacterized protein n=1 Tax=Austropuccinia psidii MF-1 TaxID=1389203 RepID=A0A9Q3HGB9_9BASI|nr:hypothetical protein [Austropuccinia psidii MF-1]
MKILQEIQLVKSSISVELGKIHATLTKITLDINDVRKNNKNSAELHKSTIAKLELISNTSGRIESKYQVEDDEVEYLSTTNINDQLKVLKNHVLIVANNTNQVSIHFARSDSERQKFKHEILAHVEQIHKSYESNPHIPIHYTPFSEEKPLKESLNPFLGENAITAKYIPKLERWPTFSGEGEHNHIKFRRTIDMFQEKFSIPDAIILGKLHFLFIRTAKKWCYQMRQDHGKHDWSWWKS